MDYKQYFGFKESPFHLTPDPAYFFPCDSHREALQTLLYSIRAGEGFVQITGDPGTGKTLLIRTILRELGDDIGTALIFNPRLSPQELLRTILEDLGLDPNMMENVSRESLLRRFRDYLLGKANEGQRVVVIIDEAQNLPMDTLEELRLLSNLETEKEKLLQIILVGQRELEQRLSLPEVRQLHQRITIRYRLEHMERDDVHSYIQHRLKIATEEGRNLSVQFTRKALKSIYRLSRGIPRLINIICERSLMAAYVDGRNKVLVSDVTKAVESIRGNDRDQVERGMARKLVSAAVVFLIVLSLGVFGSWYFRPDLFQVALSFIREQPATIVAVSGPKDREPAPLAVEGRITGAVNDEAKPVDQPPVVAEKEPSSPVDQPPVVAEKEPSPPVDLFPAAAFNVSSGVFFVQALIDAEVIQLWQGEEAAPVLVETIDYAWPHGEGLFLAGHDPDMGRYVFNHSAFLRGEPTAVASPFFSKIEDLVRGNAIPVIARVTTTVVDQQNLERAARVEQVFERFITTWKAMDTDLHLNLYGRVVSSHYLDHQKPLVWSWDQFFQRKDDVFRRSDFINVGVSGTAFLLDPTNEENVMVVYHQKYRSRVWEDDGTKALYLSLQEAGNVNAWKIVAELWVRDL